MSDDAPTPGRDDAAPRPDAQPAQPPAGGAPVRRDYPGQGIVVHWAAERCIHTGRCIAAQPGVFDPKRRPWVDLTQADADAIARAVERCPTGALAYTRTDGAPDEAIPELLTIRVGRDGPLALHGRSRVRGEHVGPVDDLRTATGRYALCRCGQTRHAPFCDNRHKTLPRGWGAAPAPAPAAPHPGPAVPPNAPPAA
jgi:uncharacterized Fe-S cluster protein YjdI/CDGSH-type Zn-finger protein